MSVQFRILTESKGGVSRERGVFPNPFYRRSLSEVRDHIDEARKMYPDIYALFRQSWAQPYPPPADWREFALPEQVCPKGYAPAEDGRMCNRMMADEGVTKPTGRSVQEIQDWLRSLPADAPPSCPHLDAAMHLWRYLASAPTWEVFPGAAALADRAMNPERRTHTYTYYARRSRRAMRWRAMFGNIDLLTDSESERTEPYAEARAKSVQPDPSPYWLQSRRHG